MQVLIIFLIDFIQRTELWQEALSQVYYAMLVFSCRDKVMKLWSDTYGVMKWKSKILLLGCGLCREALKGRLLLSSMLQDFF